MRKMLLAPVLAAMAIWPIEPSAVESPPAETANTQADAHDPFGDDDVVEVAAVAKVAEPAGFTVLGLVGKLHPMIIHFPIAWLVLLVFLRVFLVWKPEAGLRVGTKPLGVLLAFSLVPALATGLLRASSMEAPDPMVFWHRNSMLLSSLFVVAAVVTDFSLRGFSEAARTRISLSFAGVALLVQGVGAHLGGKLVYGENYLPF